MEKFSIESKVVYTIKTVDGNFEAIGKKGLQDYCDNIMGAFIDRMSASRSNNPIRAAQHDHKFLLENREDLELIFAMIDEVQSLINPVPAETSCEDYYCTRCGSGSGIEYVGE